MRAARLREAAARLRAAAAGLLVATMLAGCGVDVPAPGLVETPARDAQGKAAGARGGAAASGGEGHAPRPTATRPAPLPSPFPAPGQVFLGVTTPEGPYDLRQVDDFGSAVGQQPDVLLYAAGWAHDRFRADLLEDVRGKGLLPMVGWEPWDYRAPGDAAYNHGDQPKYALRRILAGEFDAYIDEWARGAAAFGSPMAIRFAHEMNGDWYPWAESVNGNSPGEYVKVWRYVHDRFTAAGADNVLWVWSPNREYETSQALAELYPGDEYVDWVGVVGYYGAAGTQLSAPSFDDVFGQTLSALRRVSSRPVVITETGGTQRYGRKTQWVREFFAGLKRHPEIIGFVWFEIDKEADWRVTSSPAPRRAFAEAMRDPRYGAALDPRYGAAPSSRPAP